MRFLLLQAHNQLGFRWESVLLTLTACFSHCFHLLGMHMCTFRDVSISFSSNWEALRGEKGIASSHSGTNRSEPGLPGKGGPADRCHQTRCVSELRSESALLPEIQKRKSRAWLQVEQGLCGVPGGPRRLSWPRADIAGGRPGCRRREEGNRPREGTADTGAPFDLPYTLPPAGTMVQSAGPHCTAPLTCL